MEVQDRGCKWDINDARAQRVHKFAMEIVVSTWQSAFLAFGRYRFFTIIAGAWAQGPFKIWLIACDNIVIFISNSNSYNHVTDFASYVQR